VADVAGGAPLAAARRLDRPRVVSAPARVDRLASRWVDWRGAPSRYAGGMQFLQSTWERAGGRGEPWQWSPREQLYRVYRIWDMADGVRGNRRGGFGEWGTAKACGL
jgi:hypothetical protein